MKGTPPKKCSIFFIKRRNMIFLLTEKIHSSLDFFEKPLLLVTFEIVFTQKLSHLTPLVFPRSRSNCTDFQLNCLHGSLKMMVECPPKEIA